MIGVPHVHGSMALNKQCKCRRKVRRGAMVCYDVPARECVGDISLPNHERAAVLENPLFLSL